MKGWGALLMAMGALSYVLPLVGMQFQLFALFGEGSGAAALFAIGLGLVLYLVGSVRGGTASEGESAPAVEEPESPAPSSGAEDTPPRRPENAPFCPHCGESTRSDANFCMACGGALGGEPAPTRRPAARETAQPAAAAKPGGGGRLLVLLVLAGLAYAGYQAAQNAKEEPSTTAGHQSGTTTLAEPTDEEIAELFALRDEARQALSRAEAAGNGEEAGRKAQAYQHYLTAIGHALQLREAVVLMREAQERGDVSAVQSQIHTHGHYQGELRLMLPYVPEPLARFIRRWTE